jgi:hypothetical protein
MYKEVGPELNSEKTQTFHISLPEGRKKRLF